MDPIMTARQAIGLIEKIFGSEALESTGVIHPTAVWRDPKTKTYKTIKIVHQGPVQTPSSDYDAFVLSFTRAKAEVIITSGRILKEEPKLTHNTFGKASQALNELRRHTLNKKSPPHTIILTRGEKIDFKHPLFTAGTTPIIYTTDLAPKDLEERANKINKKIQIIRTTDSSLGSAIKYAKSELRAKTISIEAGPSTTSRLYKENPELVDEVLLSVYLGKLPKELQGGPIPDPFQRFNLNSEFKTEETSGIWDFYRLTNKK
jgi:riboflavin biosynthesis pyrimidine reductase